ncbi:MAG TPA: hypothetical protein VFS21_09125 [Roseiflexaceae bacterium]|nr:hypothetical protein [Roseiflexaceae bacterium]
MRRLILILLAALALLLSACDAPLGVPPTGAAAPHSVSASLVTE